MSAPHAVAAEVRQYDRLFTDPEPTNHDDKDYIEFFNRESLDVIRPAYVEPGLQQATAGDQFQFIRIGYFCVDPDSTPERLVFNRTATLRDTWAKIQQKKS